MHLRASEFEEIVAGKATHAARITVSVHLGQGQLVAAHLSEVWFDDHEGYQADDRGR